MNIMRWTRVIIFHTCCFALLLISCKQVFDQPECKNFREAIIKNQFKARYLFTISAEYNGEQLRILTDKFRLIHLLNEREEIIDSLIMNDGMVHLNDSTFNKVQVLKAQTSIDTILLSGKEKTLETYFEADGWQRKGVLNHPEEINLVNALTNWCVLVSQDDVSGYLRIEESDIAAIKSNHLD
jgi:hypothetical protein